MNRCENKYTVKLKFINQKMLFYSFLGPFWCLFSAPGSPFGVLPNISFCHTNSLMDIYFHTKSQNKAIDGSPNIFNRCYFQISGIFYVYFSTSPPPDKRWKTASFCLIQNIDIVLTENAKNPFVAIILIVSLISFHYKVISMVD